MESEARRRKGSSIVLHGDLDEEGLNRGEKEREGERKKEKESDEDGGGGGRRGGDGWEEEKGVMNGRKRR